MKAMIFAAGLGTRLKPLTDHMPKALVPVAGKPMLEHVIRKLIASGCDEIVINVHHFADQIIDFVKANNNFGITIHISDETDMLLDTGGGNGCIIRNWHNFYNQSKRNVRKIPDTTSPFAVLNDFINITRICEQSLFNV